MGLVQGTLLINLLPDGYEYQVVKVRHYGNGWTNDLEQLGDLHPYAEDNLHAVREWFEEYFQLAPTRSHPFPVGQ
jgi:hypothetical protein